MFRSRLALLATTALLSTSFDPFGWMNRPAPGEMASVALEESERDSQAPTLAETSDLSAADEAAVADIFRRLSARHTGLPDAERMRLAHAVVLEARAQGLEPELVIAVIEVESAGYPLAVSHVGAMGLMQLLPSTGQEVAEELDVPWVGDDTLFDPFVNVRLGTAYLRYLADRYDNVNTALAAYNWGPGRIDRRLRRGATVPSKYIEQVRRAYARSILVASRAS